MDEIKLKPCPFCGGKAKIIVVVPGEKSIIACTTSYCGFTRHSYNNGDTDENAALQLATLWNRRVTADVVEVVRCKDCVFCSPETPISNRCLMTNECVDKLHFCGHGERKK